MHKANNYSELFRRNGHDLNWIIMKTIFQ